MGYHTVPDTSNHFYSLSCFFHIFFVHFIREKKMAINVSEHAGKSMIQIGLQKNLTHGRG
ncbi:MAG: hypothetical protein BWX55_01606 [Deltaproteobacteria bacterium ADurb.Bin022]|jgi:hypothetical protein|nr:MAG: hypothetical protein BWX55_01606 [Deltaproteobacteria bacterium ADurb.Bin022]